MDKNRVALGKCANLNEVLKYLQRKGLVDGFVNYAAAAGLKPRNLLIRRSRKLLNSSSTPSIVGDVLDESAAAAYVGQDDPAMLRALKLLKEGQSFPTKPKATAWNGVGGFSPYGWACGLLAVSPSSPLPRWRSAALPVSGAGQWSHLEAIVYGKRNRLAPWS